MPTLEDLATNEEIKAEYKKTFLLNLFRKMCVRMNKDPQFKAKIRKLFLETYDKVQTTTIIIKRYLDYDLQAEEAKLVSIWFNAYLQKASHRKAIPLDLKKELCRKQNGKCMVCGEDLGGDWSKIHVDHIIPWILVGDELDDNYQALCDTCNECKSARTDYIFKSMLNLV